MRTSSAYARARILESARARSYHSNHVNGKYTEDFRQKTETERKEACYLTSSRIPVEFSLLLAFLGPLEGSAVEKVRRTSLQYPTTPEAVYLCNGVVSEKSQARSLIPEWGGSLFSVGGPRAMCAKSAVARGVWGHAPQEIF